MHIFVKFLRNEVAKLSKHSEIYSDDIHDVLVMFVEYRSDPNNRLFRDKLIENRRTIFRIYNACNEELRKLVEIQIRRLILHDKYSNHIYRLLEHENAYTQIKRDYIYYESDDAVFRKISGMTHNAGYISRFKPATETKPYEFHLIDRLTKEPLLTTKQYRENIYMKDVIDNAIDCVSTFKV